MMTLAFDSVGGMVSNRVAETGLRSKHVCKRCGQARARFTYRGRVKARRDHDLCQRCYRTLKAGLARWAAAEFAATS
jgi:hypothetical protein